MAYDSLTHYCTFVLVFYAQVDQKRVRWILLLSQSHSCLFCAFVAQRVRVKLGLICWQKDVSQKALEGNYQWDDVVRLEYKRGICLVSKERQSHRQTDRCSSGAGRHKPGFYPVCLFLVPSPSPPYLYVYLLINQYLHLFLYVKLNQQPEIQYDKCTNCHLRVPVCSRWFLIMCFYLVFFWMVEIKQSM